MVVEWSWSFKFYEWFASQVWSGIVCLVKWGQTLFSFSLLYFWRDRKDTCTHAYKALQIKEIWASSSPDISFVSFIFQPFLSIVISFDSYHNLDLESFVYVQLIVSVILSSLRCCPGTLSHFGIKCCGRIKWCFPKQNSSFLFWL